MIAILVSLLLGYLNKTQQDIKRQIVETELNGFRLSLAEALVHKSINNQSIDSAVLQNSNPMLIIAEHPENYIGELSEAPSNKNEIWYFDTTKKQLTYVFNDSSQARYRLSKTAGQTKASLLTLSGLDLVKDAAEVNQDCSLALVGTIFISRKQCGSK